MALIYLPFIILFYVIISSTIAVVIAFVLKRAGRFNLLNMASATGVFLYLIAISFHLWSLSHYQYSDFGGVLMVSEGAITLSGYVTTAIQALVYAIVGGLSGLVWYFVFNRLSKASDT